MSELVRFLSGDNDVAQKTQMDPQNPTAKFVPLEPGQVLFGLEVVEDGSLLGTIYYDYKDKNGIITRVSMGNGGAGGSGGGGGIIKTLATTDGKHESDEVTATANTIIPLPKKIFANLLSAKTQFNFPKVHDPSNTAYVNEDAAPGQSYLYGNGLHMVNPFNTLQDGWIRTIGKSGSAEATLELAMRDNASNEYIYDQIVARHYKADGTIVTDTDGHKREVVILGKEGESQFPGPVTSQRGFVGDVDGNAKSATKAKQDWYDQVIDSTYLSKIVKTTHNGSKFEITSYDGRYTPVGSADAKKDVITIPGATTTLAGLVTTGDQTITGNKTINSSGTLTIMKQGGFIYSGIQEDKATNKNLPIWFSTGTANGTPNYSTELTYNPSTGTVTAKKFAGPATSATYDAEGGAIHDKYLKRAGGTMTGALKFADNTYNAFGDDIEIGSQNAKGKLNIHGKNGATGIVFVPYSGTTSQTISIDGAGVMTITGTLKATLDGNASTATTLKTARNFNITDSSAAYSGPSVSFNGSADVTLHMPDTFAGALKGNADTATKLATARTLWGQSFNGTANVSGNMTGVGNVTSTTSNTYTLGTSSNLWKAVYATTFHGALSGNASTATTLKTARNFHITDSSATYNGPNASFNGSADITLHMPSTFAGTLKGNADTATKLATARTLWGQSFNGTANISGNMSGVGNVLSAKTNTHTLGASNNVWKAIYATTFYGAVSGNASSATKLETARSFHITDSSATYNGASATFDGTGDITLHMPDTFAGTLKGNADSATKLKTARTLWGQSFNGSANVTGAMSNVGNITSLKTNTHDIGSSSNVWKNVYATTFHGALDGKATSAGSADMANQVTHVLTIEGQSYDGSTDVAVGNTVFYIVGNSTDTTAGTWTGTDSKIKSYYNGLTIIYVPKVDGASTTTLNLNGLGAKTCYYSNTSKLTTHFAKGTPILLTYIDGYWRRADYDSNTNTQLRVYRQKTSDSAYNKEYPLLVSRTQASGIGTADSDGSYTSIYGIMNNDTAKIPTLNVHTGAITATSFKGTASNAINDVNGAKIDETYLKKSGGTMTGALNFANNTYNAFGDDVEIGDRNTAGKLYIHGKNGATGIVFAPYTGSTSQTISIDGAGVMTITGTVKTTLSGNASTATTLKTARNFHITDSSATYNGPNASFNGSADVTLHMPDTFAGTLKGNADSATKLKTARTLWGQSFNGSANVTGAMSSVGNITSLKTNTHDIGSSSNVWKNIYATTFHGALSGNASTASKWQTARNFQVDLALDNPATVKVDGTKDVILPVTGILATKHGGTGNSSHTANRLVWSETATKLSATNNHYASASKIAVNYTSAPSTNFYVNGTSYLNGNTTINGQLYMAMSNSAITWNQGTYWQRMITEDDSASGTHIFKFQVSSNSGSSWTDILRLANNGQVRVQNNVGGIYKLQTTASTVAAVQVISDNQDSSIFKVCNGTAFTDSWSCGFDLVYNGTGADVNNLLTLYAGNHPNTTGRVVGWSVNQAGQMGIRTTPSTSYALNINGNTHTNGIVYINNSTEAGKDNAGALIVGPTGGVNLGIDSNEITARNNKAVSTLYLNPHGGLVQIGTGGLRVTSQTRTDGPLLIGSAANGRDKNYIAFYGTTSDGAGSFNHTYIGENLYGGTESSELVLFKGAEMGSAPEDMRYASGPGPDRIRHIAAGHLFQIYRTALSGTFATIAQSTVPISIFEVNQQGVVVYNEGTDANNYPAKITFKVKDTVHGTTSTATIAAYSDHGTASYGSNLVISSGGNTLIQAGDGAYGSYANLIGTGVNQGENLYLTADGNIQLCASADTVNRRLVWDGTTFYPVLSNTFHLGSKSYRWASAHVYRDFNIYGTESTGDESHVRFCASDNSQRAIIAFNGNTTNTLDATTHLKIATNYGDIRLDAASNYINVKGHILPRADFTATNYNIGSTTRRWGNVYANALRLQGPSSDPSEAQGARIEFAFDNGGNRSQPVYISYTPNDGYRAPYGLKIFGTEAANYGAWLEVQGAIGTSNTNASSGIGISLYGGPINGKPTYGMFFGGTATFGKLYNTTSSTYGVSSDWATYFTMSDTTNRGWLFMRGATNVAGITGNGTFLSVVTTGSHIAGNQGKVIIDGTAGAGYNMLFRQKSTNGVFTGGAYNAEWNLYYTADSVIKKGTNGTSYEIRLMNEAGNTRLNRLGINGENTGYQLYVNGTSYYMNKLYFTADTCIIQNQASTSNSTTAITWYKGGTSQNTYNPSISQHNTGGDGTGSITILPYATATAPWEGSVGLFIQKGLMKLDGKRVPTTGNSTGTVGSSTYPIYSNAGTLTQCSYYLQANIKSYSGSLASGGWNTLNGKSGSPTIAIAYNNGAAAWNSETYSATMVWGCGDTRGFIDCGYDASIVTFGGASYGNSTNNAPKWYMKLSGTNGTTYNLNQMPAATAATYVKDRTNGTATYLNYGASGIASSSWYCAWNGYEVRAISPANLATHLATSTLDARYVNVTGDTMTGMLRVNNAPIFGYRYGQSNNAPAFVFDKPGTNYTGIGANGSSDTIYFGAVGTDGNWNWVTSHKQKWVFNGTVTADQFNGPATSANYLNVNNSANCAYGLQYIQTSAQTAGGDLPTATWWHVIKMNHGTGDTYYKRLLAFNFWTGNDIRTGNADGDGKVDAWYKVWCQGNSVTGAVWNDYAECRESDTQEAGYVLAETGKDNLVKTTERLQHFAGVSSDTWGFSQGETEKAKTPIAVAGRVLVYPYQDRDNYQPGDCVCAAPGGTVDIMTREEVVQYPDRIVGTVSCVPDYEEWGGGEGADRDPVKVNGRIWIKVR